MVDESWDTYFWILCLEIGHTSNYRKLLWKLHTTEFRALLRMDENRIADALEMRRSYSFGGLRNAVSILEVMYSLAKRLESDVMEGTYFRDRTSDWFWEMIDSLGLSGMTDSVYDDMVVSKILRRFLRRRYSPNGEGGLFTIRDDSVDMRKQEIWYQAALYLTDLLRLEGYIDP